jgi:uncharacterized protein (DUF1786 family)
VDSGSTVIMGIVVDSMIDGLVVVDSGRDHDHSR